MKRKGVNMLVRKAIMLMIISLLSIGTAFCWTARVDRYVNHTIQAGDTLEKLAKVYGTTIKSIMNKNNIVDEDLLIKGKKLLIPVVGYEEKLIL